MSNKNPEFVLRHRDNGRIFGYDQRLANEPTLEKVRFEDAFPELCMPDHVKEKVEKKKAPAKKAAKKKSTAKKAPAKKAKPLDLSTDDDDIDADPEEILSEDTLSSEIDEALSADASTGLD